MSMLPSINKEFFEFVRDTSDKVCNTQRKTFGEKLLKEIERGISHASASGLKFYEYTLPINLNPGHHLAIDDIRDKFKNAGFNVYSTDSGLRFSW